MIPKQIFKIYIGDKFPIHLQKYVDTWSKVNPDYTIKYVTESEWDSPFLKFAETQKHRGMLINAYLRMRLLYEYGGIYLDNDIECVKPFDDLLNEPITIAIEDGYVVNCAVMIAEKGNPFLKECIDTLDNFKFDMKGEPALETGPRMVTNLIKRKGWKANHVGYFGGVKVLKPEYFYPYHYTEVLTPKHITPNTYTIHHWANTWNELVSIVIPCYNQSEYLKDAIESALGQTYKNIEVIVVNDGGNDNTEEVCKYYPVKYIYQENKGLSAARNTGIKAAKGNWIVPLDSDDKLHHNFIMKTLGRADIVTTYLQCFGDRKDIWKPAIVNPTHKDFLTGNKIHYCSIFRKEIWEAVKGYDEEQFKKGKQGVNGYEDWKFWLRATNKGYKALVHPEVLMYYRKHGKTMIDEAKAAHNKIIAYMKQEFPLINKPTTH